MPWRRVGEFLRGDVAHYDDAGASSAALRSVYVAPAATAAGAVYSGVAVKRSPRPSLGRSASTATPGPSRAAFSPACCSRAAAAAAAKNTSRAERRESRDKSPAAAVPARRGPVDPGAYGARSPRAAAAAASVVEASGPAGAPHPGCPGTSGRIRTRAAAAAAAAAVCARGVNGSPAAPAPADCGDAGEAAVTPVTAAPAARTSRAPSPNNNAVGHAGSQRKAGRVDDAAGTATAALPGTAAAAAGYDECVNRGDASRNIERPA